MTVQQMIDLLSSMDRSAEVRLAVDYGDRGHTTIALRIDRVEECTLAESAYGQRCVSMEEAFDLEDEDDAAADDVRTEVVIAIVAEGC